VQQQSESHPRSARPAHAAGVIPSAALATVTIIASLHLRGMGPTMALPGAADAPAFEAYVRDVLAPTVRPGQIVPLDTARIHRSPHSAEIIAARGCELCFCQALHPMTHRLRTPLPGSSASGARPRRGRRTRSATRRGVRFRRSAPRMPTASFARAASKWRPTRFNVSENCYNPTATLAPAPTRQNTPQSAPPTATLAPTPQPALPASTLAPTPQPALLR